MKFRQWLESVPGDWDYGAKHCSNDPNLNCPDCEVKISGEWRTGICDECGGGGSDEEDDDCDNCEGTGHPRCCRCEGTGIDKH